MAGSKTRRPDKLHDDALCGIYWSETALAEALPSMIDNASGGMLKTGLRMLLNETQGQIEKLESIFHSLGKDIQARECAIMSSILREGKITVQSALPGEETDAAIIETCQKAERHSMASYKTLLALSEELSKRHEAGSIAGAGLKQAEQAEVL